MCFPKITAVSSWSDDSDPELDHSSLPVPEDTSDALSNIFAIPRDTWRTAETPFTAICDAAAKRDSETPTGDTKAPRPLIQELPGEPAPGQPPMAPTCHRDAPLPAPSEDKDSDLLPASPPGNATLISRPQGRRSLLPTLVGGAAAGPEATHHRPQRPLSLWIVSLSTAAADPAGEAVQPTCSWLA